MQHYFNGLEPAPADTACDPAQATVFPNPATAAFQVRQPGTCFLPYALAVYDAVGRKVLGRTVAGNASEAPVEVAGLAAGVYVVELRFAQRTVVKKLVKL
nr:T9SS type A sorting domain-containing protein [Hymenobacter sp. PAMC 26628]